MEISNTEQFNILAKSGVKALNNQANIKSTGRLEKDSFQKSNKVSSAKDGNIINSIISNRTYSSEYPQVIPISKFGTIPINSIYAPKQLLKAYSSPSFIKSAVEINPEIKLLLKQKGIDLKVCPKNISSIANTHITTTTQYALQIANQMNISYADKQILEMASVFHDFGKILIPEEIIEKPGALSMEEKEIMDLHAQLGYEILKTAKMNKRVLSLIKDHHNPQNSNDILCQILSVADIYSALREKRSYKDAMSEKDALDILDQKAKKGEVSTEVVNALKLSLVQSK